MPTVPVKYSCVLCGLADVEVQVPAREPDRDIIDWMNKVCIVWLSDDHRSKHPHCNPKTLKDIKIPMGTYAMPGVAPLQ